MVQTALIVDGCFGIGMAGVYAFIGRALWSRRASGDARNAALAFATWWYALGTVTAMGGAMRILAGADALTFEMLLAETYLALLPLCVALWGLLYYLLFVLTGNARLRTPIAVGYAAFYALCIVYISRRVPVGMDVDGLVLKLTYAREEPVLMATLVVLVLVPQVLAALGYLGLLLRVKERTQRYRISLVAGSVLGWFGSALLASEVGLSSTAWWPIASRAIGLVAALTILFAYLPPAWVQRKYGIRSMNGEPQGAA